MPFRPLASDADLDAALAASQQQPVVVFKHSRTCPISAAAHSTMNRVADGTPVYYLVVQDARPLSNHIAERFSVQHQSPQVLVLEQGRVTAHASHYGISTDWLRKQLPSS